MWRLQFEFWRGLEAVVRIAVLRERPPRSGAPSADCLPPATEDHDDPWRRQLSIGHGCSGPDLATPSINALDLGPDQPQSREQIAVGVVGDRDLVAALVDRLAALDVRIHATAATIDDYVALRSAGAVPHRFEDMPAVAAGIDLLISTSFAHQVGATIVARLPESASILDLAGLPGSVDFEIARRLGRRVIWAAATGETIETSWRRVAAEIEIIRDRGRH
ncbi:hypothetical protein DNX69_01465 [Rhodopseudomonas palustris]|uniref:Dipicolinate synthase subunit A N-terminal domain-containing protein n=2 Tax=Rhodopseudomonas palustris TaxID=1076 RepID=A0A323UN89_RHOPL|nr:hypothetical protein DNX69_01465 [Rhodopseudomonas palustris]